jgi:hypothetical protein
MMIENSIFRFPDISLFLSAITGLSFIGYTYPITKEPLLPPKVPRKFILIVTVKQKGMSLQKVKKIAESVTINRPYLQFTIFIFSFFPFRARSILNANLTDWGYDTN